MRESILSRLKVSPDGRWASAIGPDTRVFLTRCPVDPRPSSRALFRRLPGWVDPDSKGVYISTQGIPCVVYLIDWRREADARPRSGGYDSAGVTALGPTRITPDGKTTIMGTTRVLSTLYRVQGLK